MQRRHLETSRLRDFDNYDSRFSINVGSGKMYGEVHIVMPVTRRKDSTCKTTVDMGTVAYYSYTHV